MVRAGLRPSLADASCCSVDVVNGGAGRRACSRCATAVTWPRRSTFQGFGLLLRTRRDSCHSRNSGSQVEEESARAYTGSIAMHSAKEQFPAAHEMHACLTFKTGCQP